MRIARERLVRLATAMLAATADLCLKGRVERGPGLRLALALLHDLAPDAAGGHEGVSRAPFDAFWRACALPTPIGEEAAMAAHRRRHAAAWTAYAEILALLGPDWPGGAQDRDTERRLRRALAWTEPPPQRSGIDTRMQAPTGKSCGWL